MAVKFDELVNNMVNVGFGAAAMMAEQGKEVLEGLSAKGAEVRSDAGASDFTRSMSEIFERAGGAISEATERLSATGATTSEKILDELIRARVRDMPEPERAAFVEHVRDLVDSVAAGPTVVDVEVEVVEKEEGAAEEEAAGSAADSPASDEAGASAANGSPDGADEA